MSGKRHGFTLVELLVVIAIIGILIALLLPAVQAAREAARRIQCTNHLKQIALALHSYASAIGTFPPAAILDASDYPNTTYDVVANARSGRHGTSWMLQILPYLEQASLYDRWDFTENVVGNRGVAELDLAGFYCPTRRSAPRRDDLPMNPLGFSAGGNDYGGCIGRANAWHNALPHSFSPRTKVLGGQTGSSGSNYAGIFIPNQATAFRDLSDGSSSTLLVGELQRLWGDTDEMGREAFKSFDGWALGGVGTLFTTAFMPPDEVYLNTGGLNNGFFESPGSDHPGGANMAFADGAVRFFSENIDPRILDALGSRAGGEVVSF